MLKLLIKKIKNHLKRVILYESKTKGLAHSTQFMIGEREVD